MLYVIHIFNIGGDYYHVLGDRSSYKLLLSSKQIALCSTQD